MADPVTSVATAVQSVADLVGSILDRADRDAPIKEQNENLVTVQNAFAQNQLDSDAFRLFLDRLCNRAGNPLTPTGDVGVGRRELLHALLVNTINLIYERQLASRAFHKLTKG